MEDQKPVAATDDAQFAKWATHEFVTPTKQIVTMEDLEVFKKSEFFKNYVAFLIDVQKAVESKKISQTPLNPKFAPLINFLDQLDQWIDQIPPLQQPMRFGNKAYRTWRDKLAEVMHNFIYYLYVPQNIDSILDGILPEPIKKAKEELRVYLLDSFGSYERIDYGTGHEMNFMHFLYILRELGYYEKTEYEAMIRNVFYRYIKLMRKLQLTYMLEPAGSHGVWGIDDYHFLPFLIGASELINSDEVPTPDDIHKDSLVQMQADEYIYLSCIAFIKQVKKGVPFHESSPILNDISGTPTWDKVAKGMIKMYQAEVLFKHPVIKHMYFGSIIKLK